MPGHARACRRLSCKSVFVSVSVCQCVSMSVCQCVSMSVFQYVSVSVCQCVSMSVCQYVSVSVCQYVSVSVCQCVTMSVCQCVSVSVCQCVSVSFVNFIGSYSESGSTGWKLYWPIVDISIMLFFMEIICDTRCNGRCSNL